MARVLLERLSKRFGTVAAVHELTAEVPDGALLSFLGPSGCGKTTTLRLIAGLESPTGGEIRFDDEVISTTGRSLPPERRQIGMVFQSYAIWPHMSVFDNVAYPLKVRRHGRKEVRERTQRALEMVQLAGLENRYAAQLSGGQQQRVALARAIVFDPRILLFDEPLSNLDAKLRVQMRVEIRELQQRLGTTCIYVTHDQHEALAVSDYVAVMRSGRIVQMGTPEEIYRWPKTRFVAGFLGWENLVPASVVDGSTVEALGARLRCRVPQGAQRGSTVDMAFRPEAAMIGRVTTGGHNVVRGTVDHVTYMGEYWECGVLVNGSSIRTRAPAGQSVAKGDMVDMHLDPDRLLAIAGDP